MIDITKCPSTLVEGYKTYSPIALKHLFKKKKVDHILPYESPQIRILDFGDNQKSISISGYQSKNSMVLDGNTLRLSKANEQGTYILKPISDLPKNKAFAPANEHLTMQIAKQIYKIEVAENGLVFFGDGSPAYLTKRFDTDGKQKLAMEDFASLLQRTPATHGEHYKYTGSYLEIFKGLQKYVPLWQVESPKLFKLLVFNYLFSNGDAHLKNFSLIETSKGDYRLSPAYDLLNTHLHISDSDFALDDGLLPPSLSNGSIQKKFRTLGREASIRENIVDKILKEMTSHHKTFKDMIQRSFLPEKLQRNYLQSFQKKLKMLRK